MSGAKAKYKLFQCACDHWAATSYELLRFTPKREVCAALGWTYNGDGNGLFERPYCGPKCASNVFSDPVTEAIRFIGHDWHEELNAGKGRKPYPIFTPVYPNRWMPAEVTT